MGSYITCVDLYSPNDMFWLKTDKRCPSCFEGSYICAGWILIGFITLSSIIYQIVIHYFNIWWVKYGKIPIIIPNSVDLFPVIP